MRLLNLIFGVGKTRPRPWRSIGRRGYRATNYWEENGWVRHGRFLVGYYRTIIGACKGEIELSGSGRHRFFIIDPPDQLRRHSHWGCFLWRGGNRYLVHFQMLPQSVDAGILTIEKLIREAREQY